MQCVLADSLTLRSHFNWFIMKTTAYSITLRSAPPLSRTDNEPAVGLWDMRAPPALHTRTRLSLTHARHASNAPEHKPAHNTQQIILHTPCYCCSSHSDWLVKLPIAKLTAFSSFYSRNPRQKNNRNFLLTVFGFLFVIHLRAGYGISTILRKRNECVGG